MVFYGCVKLIPVGNTCSKISNDSSISSKPYARSFYYLFKNIEQITYVQQSICSVIGDIKLNDMVQSCCIMAWSMDKVSGSNLAECTMWSGNITCSYSPSHIIIVKKKPKKPCPFCSMLSLRQICGWCLDDCWATACWITWLVLIVFFFLDLETSLPSPNDVKKTEGCEGLFHYMKCFPFTVLTTGAWWQ